MATMDPETRNGELFPGAILQNAREQAGMTKEDVAQELRLSTSQVQALEDDNYEDMPGMTYVRGYLRCYARLLNVDEDKILPPLPAAVQRQTGETDSGSFAPIAPRQARSSDRHMRIGTVAILVATVAGLVAWWQSRDGGFDRAVSLSTRDAETVEKGALSSEGGSRADATEAPQQRTIVSMTAPEATAPALRSEATETSDAGHDAAMTDTLVATPAPVAGSAQETQPARTKPDGKAPNNDTHKGVVTATTVTPQKLEPKPAPEAEPKAKPIPKSKAARKPAKTVTESERRKIVFGFDGTSWVDVRDAENQRLLYQSMTEGRSVTVEGKPPFRIFLGNAKAVRIDYGGKPVNVAAYQEGLYARFVLGQVEQ